MPEDFEKFIRLKEDILKRKISIPFGHVVTPHDNDPIVSIGQSCEYEVAVNYDDFDNMMRLNSDVIKNMHLTEQSSLWIHEVLYKIAREAQSAQSSKSIRYILSLLLAEEENSKLIKKFSRYIIERSAYSAYGLPVHFSPNKKCSHSEIPVSIMAKFNEFQRIDGAIYNNKPGGKYLRLEQKLSTKSESKGMTANTICLKKGEYAYLFSFLDNKFSNVEFEVYANDRRLETDLKWFETRNGMRAFDRLT